MCSTRIRRINSDQIVNTAKLDSIRLEYLDRLLNIPHQNGRGRDIGITSR